MMLPNVVVSRDTRMLVACMFQMEFIFVFNHKSAQKMYFLSVYTTILQQYLFKIFTVFKQTFPFLIELLSSSRRLSGMVSESLFIYMCFI